MAAPEESRVHGRCHRCVWPRGEGPPQPPAEPSLPQGGHGSLPAEPALPRPRLPSGKGTGDTRVPRWHLFLPCAPQWRASENDICRNGAAEHGGQAAKRRSARGRGRRGVRPAGSGLTLVGPCVRLKERGSIFGLRFISPGARNGTAVAPQVPWCRTMNRFCNQRQLLGIKVHKVWREPLTRLFVWSRFAGLRGARPPEPGAQPQRGGPPSLPPSHARCSFALPMPHRALVLGTVPRSSSSCKNLGNQLGSPKDESKSR